MRRLAFFGSENSRAPGLFAVPPHALYLPVHPERAFVEVYVRPLQAKRLSHPQTTGKGQDV